MSTGSRERLLFVVMVNVAQYKYQSRLDNLREQLENDRNLSTRNFFDEVQQRFDRDSENAGFAQVQPQLLAIDWYRDLFTGVLQINSLPVTEEAGALDPAEAMDPGMLGRRLVRAIFEPLNSEEDDDFSYLTWVITHVTDLCATTCDPTVLRNRKGVGGEK